MTHRKPSDYLVQFRGLDLIDEARARADNHNLEIKRAATHYYELMRVMCPALDRHLARSLYENVVVAGAEEQYRHQRANKVLDSVPPHQYVSQEAARYMTVLAILDAIDRAHHLTKQHPGYNVDFALREVGLAK